FTSSAGRLWGADSNPYSDTASTGETWAQKRLPLRRVKTPKGLCAQVPSRLLHAFLRITHAIVPGHSAWP
ncbi:hypothetical protein HOY80DRAFT_910430, partial [Tuber brumale]